MSNIDNQIVHDSIVVKRVMQPYPASVPIVPFSTPVVSFGDPRTARIATLGINPSSREFLDAKSRLLPPGQKRLVDRDELGRPSADQLTREEANQVIDGCYRYFSAEGRPYKWFKPMEEHAVRPAGASYFEGSACHLDLVQWATDPVWGKIQDRVMRDGLLASDVEFLKYQLTRYDFFVLLLNGKEVIDQFAAVGLCELERTDLEKMSTRGQSCAAYTGRYGRTRVLGWSRNIPHYGTSRETRLAIGEWISRQIANY